jgi:hypothetical protein
MRLVAPVATLLALAGCYHYGFRQDTETAATVTYVEHPPTFVNGFIGTGWVDARAHCERPIRTELYVGATDVLVSVVTLFIYTPHTLEVVCPAPAIQPAVAGSRGAIVTRARETTP